jgi:hypothetical protein
MENVEDIYPLSPLQESLLGRALSSRSRAGFLGAPQPGLPGLALPARGQVPGDHYSMMRSPKINDLAAHLDSAIERLAIKPAFVGPR